MLPREYWIAVHSKNVEFVNRHIRVCLLARQLLRGVEQRHFAGLIWGCNANHRPELLPLREAMRTDFATRFHNYDRGLLGTIFDLRYYLRIARELKEREIAKPWLIVDDAAS